MKYFVIWHIPKIVLISALVKYYMICGAKSFWLAFGFSFRSPGHGRRSWWFITRWFSFSIAFLAWFGLFWARFLLRRIWAIWIITCGTYNYSILIQVATKSPLGRCRCCSNLKEWLNIASKTFQKTNAQVKKDGVIFVFEICNVYHCHFVSCFILSHKKLISFMQWPFFVMTW